MRQRRAMIIAAAAKLPGKPRQGRSIYVTKKDTFVVKMKLTITALALTLLATGAAHADSFDGHLQVKLLGTAVIPDGKITAVDINAVGIPATSQAKADSFVVPTIAIEYFFSKNLSAETICCVTSHNVTGRDAINGAGLISNAKIIPATLTLKYHFPLTGFKPYVGAGATYFYFFDASPGVTTKALGATYTRVDNHLGAVLQAGIDIPISKQGVSLSIDAKRYFLRTHAHWYAGSTEVLRTQHAIDPWVLSTGIAYRF